MHIGWYQINEIYSLQWNTLLKRYLHFADIVFIYFKMTTTCLKEYVGFIYQCQMLIHIYYFCLHHHHLLLNIMQVLHVYCSHLNQQPTQCVQYRCVLIYTSNHLMLHINVKCYTGVSHQSIHFYAASFLTSSSFIFLGMDSSKHLLSCSLRGGNLPRIDSYNYLIHRL